MFYGTAVKSGLNIFCKIKDIKDILTVNIILLSLLTIQLSGINLWYLTYLVIVVLSKIFLRGQQISTLYQTLNQPTTSNSHNAIIID